ncbi:hypothetical protein JST97_08695 [bacterium]|nr:hypothetical protein [bacterium]
MDTLSSRRALIFDPEIRYGCIRCGKSCRQDWDIWVHRDLPGLVEPYLAELGLSLERAFVPEDGRIRLARDQAGCRFLQDDLCALHCHLGVRRKPNFCQQYPWIFVETPAGLRVTASYTCTGVIQLAGPPLSEQRLEIESCLAQNPAVDTGLRNWQESLDFHRRFEEAVTHELWALCLMRCLVQARHGRDWDELDPGSGELEDMGLARRLVIGALLKPCLDHEPHLWQELDEALEQGGDLKIPQFNYIGSGAELLHWAACPLEQESLLERYRRSLWFRRQHLRCDRPLAGLLLNWSAAPLFRVLARLTQQGEAIERIEMLLGHAREVERVFTLLAGFLVG